MFEPTFFTSTKSGEIIVQPLKNVDFCAFVVFGAYTGIKKNENMSKF